MMSSNLQGILVSFLFIFALIGAATVLEKRSLLSKEGSRKFIHIGVSNWWLIAMAFFNSPVWAAIVPVSFIIINYISYRYNVFSAMERKGGKGDLGTVYFPISLLVLALLSFGKFGPHFGALGILVMGYGDGLAAVVGQAYGKRPFIISSYKKTIEGSLAMFAASFIVSFIFFSYYLPGDVLFASLTIAGLATVLEALTPLGLDNLSIPLGVTLIYYLLYY